MIRIDLIKMLESLRNLDIEKCDTQELLEYYNGLEYAMSAKNNMENDGKTYPQTVINAFAEAESFYQLIKAECESRGCGMASIWDMINENPEILVEALESMSLMELVDLADEVKVMAKEDRDFEPFYELIAEIIGDKAAALPSC